MAENSEANQVNFLKFVFLRAQIFTTLFCTHINNGISNSHTFSKNFKSVHWFHFPKCPYVTQVSILPVTIKRNSFGCNLHETGKSGSIPKYHLIAERFYRLAFSNLIWKDFENVCGEHCQLLSSHEFFFCGREVLTRVLTQDSLLINFSLSVSKRNKQMMNHTAVVWIITPEEFKTNSLCYHFTVRSFVLLALDNAFIFHLAVRTFNFSNFLRISQLKFWFIKQILNASSFFQPFKCLPFLRFN